MRAALIPEWIPAWAAELTFFQALVGAALVVGALWVLYRAGKFLVKQFFPGLLAFAKAIVNWAAIAAALNGLPDFIERTDERLGRHSQKIDGIYHETHKNDGSSIKDAVGRLEKGVAGLYAQIGELREADEEIRADIENTQPPKGSS